MSIIVNIDSEELVEPNLLTPRRQPNGPVKIDWSLDITRKMRFCWDAGYPDIDLVSGSRWEQYGTNDALIVTKEGLRAAYFDGSACLHFYNAQRQLAGDAITVFSILHTKTNTGTLICIRDGSNANFQTYLSSDVLKLRIGNGTEGSLNTIPQDTWHTTHVLRTAPVSSGTRGFIDNSDEHISSIFTSAVDPGDVGIMLGARGDGAGGIAFQHTGYIATAFVWDRTLSDGERTALWLDPYHFLIPA